MTTRRVVLAIGAAVLCAAGIQSVRAQETPPVPPTGSPPQVAPDPQPVVPDGPVVPDRQPAEAERQEALSEGPVHPNERAELSVAAELSDVELASWLLIQNKLQAQVSGHAAQRAQRDEVRQFAARIGEGHERLMAALHGPLVQEGEQFDFAGTLREIGQRLEEVSEARRRVSGFRGQATQPPAAAPAAADRRELGRQIREQREEVQQQREDLREAEGDRGLRREEERQEAAESEELRAAQARLQQERERLAELRGERRAAIGRVLRDAMPAIRENLPATIEAVAAVIESAEANERHMGLIQFQNEVADRWADTVRAELDRKEGEDYDRAYLEYTIVSHAKMVDALTLAQSIASQQMRPIIDQVLASTQQHLDQARQLAQR